jgi:hypothetical protein
MGQYIPHRRLKNVKLTAQPSDGPASREVFAAEDPEERRRRIEAESAERRRVEGDRIARAAQRREARQRAEAELDAIEEMAQRAFPWPRLARTRAMVDAVVVFPGSHTRPSTGVALWWSLIAIHGPSLGTFPGQLSPTAIAMLRATCPVTLDSDRIDPLIELVARYLTLVDPDFNAEAFRAKARVSAIEQIGRRRQTIAALRLGGARIEEIDGWVMLDTGRISGTLPGAIISA